MRRITSIILAVAFIIVSVSGVQMDITPKPQNTQQQMLGSQHGEKRTNNQGRAFYPKTAHEWAGYLFIGAGLVHVGLNIRPMQSYLTARRSRSVIDKAKSA